MKTEREKFEAWHFLDWKLNNAVTDTVEIARELYDRVYSHDHTSSIRDVEFKAWQAAKADAVPEGFVLMPKEPTPEIVGEFWNNWLVECPNAQTVYYAYQAMISAGEKK